jgi:hypothetical protein
MLLLLKLSLTTVTFYVLLTLILEAGLFILVRIKGVIGIQHSWFGLGAIFGIVWVFSFAMAWRFPKLSR